MFDVAVSCKNLLRDLISCSAQDQVVKGIFSQEADSSGNQAVANYLPQSGRPDEERTFIILIQRVSPLPCRSRNGSGCFSSWLGTYHESYLGSSGHNVMWVQVPPGGFRLWPWPACPCWVEWLYGRGACWSARGIRVTEGFRWDVMGLDTPLPLICNTLSHICLFWGNFYSLFNLFSLSWVGSYSNVSSCSAEIFSLWLL